MSTGTAEHWVDIEEVASHLGVNKDSVYRWIDSKLFPAHRVGRLFRFKLSEVDSWVRQGSARDELGKKPSKKGGGK